MRKLEFSCAAATVTVSGQWAGCQLDFASAHTSAPRCFSILNQFEKDLVASRICRFCVSFSFRCFCVVRKHSALHLVGQPVSQCIDTPANRTDRNGLVLLVSYARLGTRVAQGRTPDGCENASASCGDIRLSIATVKPRLFDLRPHRPGVRCKANDKDRHECNPKTPVNSAIGYLQHPTILPLPIFFGSPSPPSRSGLLLFNQCGRSSSSCAARPPRKYQPMGSQTLEEIARNGTPPPKLSCACRISIMASPRASTNLFKWHSP